MGAKVARDGRHKWDKVANNYDVVWTCRHCKVIAHTPFSARGPATLIQGRTYNGRDLEWNERIPHCLGKGGDLSAPAGVTKVRHYDLERVIRIDVAYCRKVLERTLGVGYICQRIKDTGAGDLDDGQELELMRLHAALRVIDLDALDCIIEVTERLRELRHHALDEAATSGLGSWQELDYAPKSHRSGGRDDG